MIQPLVGCTSENSTNSQRERKYDFDRSHTRSSELAQGTELTAVAQLFFRSTNEQFLSENYSTAESAWHAPQAVADGVRKRALLSHCARRYYNAALFVW
jgi:hypothetical protein